MVVAITVVTRSTSLDNEGGERHTAERCDREAVSVAAALELRVRT